MINKIAESVESALADVKDGSTILVGGFGTAGDRRRESCAVRPDFNHGVASCWPGKRHG